MNKNENSADVRSLNRPTQKAWKSLLGERFNKQNNNFDLPSIIVPHPLTMASSPVFSGAKDGSGRQAGPTSLLNVNDFFNFRIISGTFQPWKFQPWKFQPWNIQPQCLNADSNICKLWTLQQFSWNFSNFSTFLKNQAISTLEFMVEKFVIKSLWLKRS